SISVTYPTTSEIYTLSLHDALPIYSLLREDHVFSPKSHRYDFAGGTVKYVHRHSQHKVRIYKMRRRVYLHSKCICVFCVRNKLKDRKSTRLNSSHVKISYAVFCLKK